MLHTSTKHIEIDFHCVREGVAENLLDIKFFFTKHIEIDFYFVREGVAEKLLDIKFFQAKIRLLRLHKGSTSQEVR
jgi:hypothetical protein